jgi:hypothetical protein
MRYFSTILLIAASVLMAGCSDKIESSHPTLASAKEDIQRGWIPPILPASAVQIHESHDIDVNIGHGTFVFGVEGSEEFKTALTPLPAGEKIGKGWIPRERMEREGYSFYSYRAFYLAVDWSSRRGEFWIGYSP